MTCPNRNFNWKKCQIKNSIIDRKYVNVIRRYIGLRRNENCKNHSGRPTNAIKVCYGSYYLRALILLKFKIKCNNL